MHSISSPTAKYTRTQLSAGPRVPSGGVTRQGVVPSPTVSPFLIVNKSPPLLLLLLLLLFPCSRALHLLVQHVLYRDTLCAEQTHSSQLCSVVPLGRACMIWLAIPLALLVSKPSSLNPPPSALISKPEVPHSRPPT